MPTKTKAKKKQTKSRTTTAAKATSRKKTARKKPVKISAVGRRKALAKAAGKPKKRTRAKNKTVASAELPSQLSRTRSGRQSGDLQGLSRVERADSESVAELLEEGNTFEAEVVSGVEAAGADEQEVRTHEVPEDDVPAEYLDKD